MTAGVSQGVLQESLREGQLLGAQGLREVVINLAMLTKEGAAPRLALRHMAERDQDQVVLHSPVKAEERVNLTGQGSNHGQTTDTGESGFHL